MKKKLSKIYFPFYHKTNIILLDDNVDFLSHLKKILSDQFHGFILDTHSSDIVLDAVKKSDKDSQKLKSDLFIKSLPDLENVSVSIEDQSITFMNSHNHKILKSKSLRNIFSVLVLDNDMPDLSGIEVARLLKDTNVKIILLTGVTSNRVAIDAFNEGVIEKFIRKDSETCVDNLVSAIRELKQKFFEDLLSEYQCWVPDILKKLVYNEDFVKLFDQTSKSIGGSSYCFTPDPFGFVINGLYEEKHLLLRSRKQVSAQLEMATDANYPKDVIKKIKNPDCFPYKYNDRLKFFEGEMLKGTDDIAYFIAAPDQARLLSSFNFNE